MVQETKMYAAPGDWLRALIYPIKMPNRTRDRPMQVLALGLPRSGTDSLRNALQELGVREVYHAFYVQEVQPDDGRFWMSVLQARKAGVPLPKDAAFWDRVLGQCGAVTDLPCCNFAVELMEAYPDAKIILNRRPVDLWHSSAMEALKPIYDSWTLYVFHFFQAQLFWLTPLYYWTVHDWFDGSLERNGKEVANRHYRELEQYCRDHNRTYINWQPTEGWDPVCKLLDKPVPTTPFPRGNARGAENQAKVRGHLEEKYRTATRNLTMTVVAVTATIAAVGAYAVYGKSP